MLPISAPNPTRPRRRTAPAGRAGTAPGSFAGIAAVLFLVSSSLVPTAPVEAKKPKDPEDLFNPLLGIDYSHWLVGPAVQIASEREVDEYLRLTSDEQAKAFIEAFWRKRGESVGLFEKSPEQLFEERAVEADKRFTEGTYPGRRTDRGTILILYGEPEKISFETPERIDVPTLELWTYPKGSQKGIDGKKPKKRYRFVRLEDSVVLYTGQTLRPSQRRRPLRPY